MNWHGHKKWASAGCDQLLTCFCEVNSTIAGTFTRKIELDLAGNGIDYEAC